MYENYDGIMNNFTSDVDDGILATLQPR